jgi:anti-sigma regulatory factor (Ser/Thr protein kinase)
MDLSFEREGSSLSLPAKYSSLWTYVGWIEARLPGWACSELVRVGIAEALSNAIIHGALEVDGSLRDAGEMLAWLESLDAAEQRDTAATICVSLAVRANAVHLCVDGGGRGFDWRNAERRVGRGLSIIHAAFDHVRWNDSGTALFVTVCKP